MSPIGTAKFGQNILTEIAKFNNSSKFTLTVISWTQYSKNKLFSWKRTDIGDEGEIELRFLVFEIYFTRTSLDYVTQRDLGRNTMEKIISAFFNG